MLSLRLSQAKLCRLVFLLIDHPLFTYHIWRVYILVLTCLFDSGLRTEHEHTGNTRLHVESAASTASCTQSQYHPQRHQAQQLSLQP